MGKRECVVDDHIPLEANIYQEIIAALYLVSMRGTRDIHKEVQAQYKVCCSPSFFGSAIGIMNFHNLTNCK